MPKNRSDRDNPKIASESESRYYPLRNAGALHSTGED
jgi:hypothetical protein